MNEKIKQLTRQALDECKSDDIEMIHAYMMDKYGIVEIPQCFSEKFAELIVKECADFADEHNDASEGVTLGVGKAIKEHFGVEDGNV